MGKVCSYPGCKSEVGKNFPSPRSKKITFFYIPKDPQQRKMWQAHLNRSEPLVGTEVICNKHLIQNSSNVVCQIPFHTINNDVFIMDEGQMLSLGTQFSQEEDETQTLTSWCNVVDSAELFADTYSQPETSIVHNIETYSLYKHWNILEQIANITLPEKWTYMIKGNNVIIGKWKRDGTPAKRMFLKQNSVPQVFLNNEVINVPEITAVNSIDDILKNVQILQPLRLCNGSTTEKWPPEQCSSLVDSNKTTTYHGHYYCENCRIVKRRENRLKKRKLTLLDKDESEQKIAKITTIDLTIEEDEVELKDEIENLRIKCFAIQERVPDDKIKKLPLELQENIRAYFKAVKRLKNGIRYTQQWIYECLLMRIKSRKLYDHLRSHDILPLPRVDLLHKCIQETHNAYGFREAIFQSLKEKVNQLPSCERRGSLLAGKIKLSQDFRFQSDMDQNFIDLDKYLPEPKKNEFRNHAFIFMFQSFQGKWVQALACFLSNERISTTNDVLTRIILECIILLETAGLFCDVIMTDAEWYRSIWTRFGITEENTSCQHPCDAERRLWFSLNFSHLIKNFRNWIVARDEIWTPDGIIKKKHWKALLDLKKVAPLGLNISFNFSTYHLTPKLDYRKSNLTLALQFFSQRLATAMTFFKSEHPDLIDCDSTIKFIIRVNTLISIMLSRTPEEALKLNSAEYEHIHKFIQFLNEWEKKAKEMNFMYLKDNTALGLKITLKTILEVLDFLTFQWNNQHLMTARINQGALEQFFHLAKGVFGPNDYLDRTLFNQMFRLMSTYSLVNLNSDESVVSEEEISSMLSSNIIKEALGKEKFLRTLDSIIIENNADFNTNLPIVGASDTKDEPEANSIKYFLAYMAGYIVHKVEKWTSCQTCIRSLESYRESKKEENGMIKVMYRSMRFPSEYLKNMLIEIEKELLTIVKDEYLQADTLLNVYCTLHELSPLSLVGCYEHKKDLSKCLINFYLIIRANFLGKAKNKTP